MKNLRTWIILAVTAVFLTLSISPANAQTNIAFTHFETENDFPRGFTYKTAVASDVDIVSATRDFHLRNEFASDSFPRIDCAFEPGRAVDLGYN